MRDEAFVKRRVAALLGALAVIATGCGLLGGETLDEAAVALIEGQDMQDQLNLGVISNARCDVPESEEVGTTFACTADSPQGQLQYEVEVDREDHIFASPTNVVSLEAQDQLANEVFTSIADDAPFTPEALDCGNDLIVFDPDGAPPTLSCQLGALQSSDLIDIDIAVTDVETGAFDVTYGLGFEILLAVSVIEGQEMQNLLNVGPLTNVTCEQPPTNDVGTIFPCVADAEPGQVRYNVEINQVANVIARTANAILPEFQARLAAEAAVVLNNQVGSNLAEDSIDCGNRAVLFEEREPMLLCALTSPDTGDVFDTIITITNVETGQFVVEVADTPRP